MLTLVEETLLLTFRDKTGRPLRLPEYSIEFAVAGAVLAELALKDRIDSDLDTLMVVDEARTGDDVLDLVLRELAASPERQTTKHWLLRLARVDSLREGALERLTEQGVLRHQKRRLPFSFGEQRYQIANPEKPRSIKARIREILTTDVIPDPRDVILVCLGHACELLGTILNRRDLKAASERIQQVTRMDLIGQGLLRELKKTHDVIRRVGWWGVSKIELESGTAQEGA